MKDVVKYEKIVDEKVLKCFCSICKYYNRDIKIINEFTNIYKNIGEK